MKAKGRKAKRTTPKDYTFKYQGKNPLLKLREGEPYFWLRAQDELSSETVQFYASLLKRESDKAREHGMDKVSDELLKQSIGVLRVAEAFVNWQHDNERFVKLPD